jgi:hypothetical protein
MMSLFTATLSLGLLLMAVGIFFLIHRRDWQEKAIGIGRSKIATIVLFGSALAWFLWIVANLGEGDFGEYRQWLFLLFGAVGMAAFWYVPDFLAIRGLAALLLLVAYEFLMAAYMETPESRLFMVSAVYVLIVLALFLGALPYLWRNGLNWLFAHKKIVRSLGALCAVYGLLLAVISFNY